MLGHYFGWTVQQAAPHKTCANAKLKKYVGATGAGSQHTSQQDLEGAEGTKYMILDIIRYYYISGNQLPTVPLWIASFELAPAYGFDPLSAFRGSTLGETHCKTIWRRWRSETARLVWKLLETLSIKFISVLSVPDPRLKCSTLFAVLHSPMLFHMLDIL